MRTARWLAAAALFFLCANAYSRAVVVSLSSGLFFPKEKIYRDVYGQSLPLDLEIRLGIGRHFGLAAGLEFLSDTGRAFNVNQGEDDYPVRLRMVSFPASIYFLYPLAKVSLFLGVGLSYHSYEEKWESAALSHKGKKTNLVAYTGAELRFSSRISARLALRYESIEVEPASVISTRINLGGISLLGGISFRLL